MMKNDLHRNLDHMARKNANGHYVERFVPGPSPERDKTISDAIIKLKANRRVKAHP